ncbi:ATP-binding protein [Pontiella sp.]|uniref:ATP-binding protein n=1 Tax=Pontiella sp. TaxID=2837462 RepID=UPI003567BCEE
MNSMRHGWAKKVRVQLKLAENVFQLTVLNDGLPFPDRVESGLGLKLMHRSARQMGGSIGFCTIPEGQTCLRCRVPAPSGS